MQIRKSPVNQTHNFDRPRSPQPHGFKWPHHPMRWIQAKFSVLSFIPSAGCRWLRALGSTLLVERQVGCDAAARRFDAGRAIEDADQLDLARRVEASPCPFGPDLPPSLSTTNTVGMLHRPFRKTTKMRRDILFDRYVVARLASSTWYPAAAADIVLSVGRIMPIVQISASVYLRVAIGFALSSSGCKSCPGELGPASLHRPGRGVLSSMSRRMPRPDSKTRNAALADWRSGGMHPRRR